MGIDIKDCLLELPEEVFPFWGNYRDNKKLEDKIKKLSKEDERTLDLSSLSVAGDLSQVPLNFVIEAYNKSLERKVTIENKAKINVLGVTIFTSILTAVTKNVILLYSAINNEYMQFFFYISGIITVFYIMVGGYFALKVLMTRMYIYLTVEKVRILPYDIQKNFYGKNIELNGYSNLIRTNYIYTSYQCMRNGLFIFFFLFIVSLWPGLYVDKENDFIKEYGNKVEYLQYKINDLEYQLEQMKGRIVRNEKVLDEVLTPSVKNK